MSRLNSQRGFVVFIRSSGFRFISLIIKYLPAIFKAYLSISFYGDTILKRDFFIPFFICDRQIRALQEYTVLAFYKSADSRRNFLRVPDSFRKIVVVKDDMIPWHDEHGILYVGIEQFLLEENAVDI